jgi:hypothetical protein
VIDKAEEIAELEFKKLEEKLGAEKSPEAQT